MSNSYQERVIAKLRVYVAGRGFMPKEYVYLNRKEANAVLSITGDAAIKAKFGGHMTMDRLANERLQQINELQFLRNEVQRLKDFNPRKQTALASERAAMVEEIEALKAKNERHLRRITQLEAQINELKSVVD